jgi:hypothetical protein
MSAKQRQDAMSTKRIRRNRAPYQQPFAAAVVETRAPFWRRNQLAPLAGILVAMFVYRLIMMAGDPGPTGSDAGNWLAFSHELFGGHVKAADSMYFPVTLVLLKAFMVVFPPLLALKLLGALASVSIGVPFYFLMKRSCSHVMALILTICMLMAGYSLEMLAWGGYPQLFGTTFLLGSLILLDEGLADGSKHKLIAGGALAALVAGTHHFSLLILAAVLALYLPATAWRRRAELKLQARRFATWAIASAGFGLVFAPWYVWYLRLLAGDGSLNANKEFFANMGDVFSFVYAEAPLTWMALMVLTPIMCFAPFGKPDGWRVRPLGLALIFGTGIVYLATKEVRIFQVMQVGILLCLGVFAGKVEDYLVQLREKTSFAIGGVGWMTYGVGVASLLLIFLMNGNLRLEGANRRYMSIDANAKDALDWVRTSTPSDSRFLASGGRAGWVNYAWWVEGYGERKSLGTILPSFLAFKEERAQANDANRMVDPDASADEVKTLVEQNKIDYLFIYKPNGGSFQNLVDKVPVVVAHQNDEFVVLKVRRDTGSAAAKP